MLEGEEILHGMGTEVRLFEVSVEELESVMEVPLQEPGDGEKKIAHSFNIVKYDI